MSNGASTGEVSVYKPGVNGYYGRKGNSSSSSVRHLPGGKEGARKFFDNVTQGYKKERQLDNNKGVIRTMPDGAIIVYRNTSASDKTATVEFNGGQYKEQKIHFIN